MKLIVELGPDETPELADEQLLKAILTKRELKEEFRERYHDPAFNEFHDLIIQDHLNLVGEIQNLVAQHIDLRIERKI